MSGIGAGERRPVRVRVLGPLALDGLPAASLGSRKGRTLLTLLAAARGRPVGVDVAADVLWGDAPPASPSDQLSVLASRLRRVLGSDCVARSDAGYALHADRVDVVELELLVAEAAERMASGRPAAAAAAARAALALDRGPLAADERAPWFDDARRLIDRELLHARSVLAEAALATGDYRSAAVAAQHLIDADPYDEAAAATLMRAHLGAGRPSSALAAYAELRRRLVDDLGASPSSVADRSARHARRARGLVADGRAGCRLGPRRLVGRRRNPRHRPGVARRPGGRQLGVVRRRVVQTTARMTMIDRTSACGSSPSASSAARRSRSRSATAS